MLDKTKIVSILTQRVNPKTDKKEWALISRKKGKNGKHRVLRWFGAKKPTQNEVAKAERTIQYWKYHGFLDTSFVLLLCNRVSKLLATFEKKHSTYFNYKGITTRGGIKSLILKELKNAGFWTKITEATSLSIYIETRMFTGGADDAIDGGFWGEIIRISDHSQTSRYHNSPWLNISPESDIDAIIKIIQEKGSFIKKHETRVEEKEDFEKSLLNAGYTPPKGYKKPKKESFQKWLPILEINGEMVYSGRIRGKPVYRIGEEKRELTPKEMDIFEKENAKWIEAFRRRSEHE